MEFVKSSRGPSGLAELACTGNKIRVTFLEGDATGKVYEVFKEDAPRSARDGQGIVRMNSTLTEIFSISPPKGDYIAKFAGFVSKKGELPCPKKVEAKTVQTNEKVYNFPAGLEFSAVYEVQSKKYVGYEAVQSHLPYIFHPNAEGNAKAMGPGITKLEKFFRINGVDDLVIPFSENLLPKLQEMLLSADKLIRISVNNGGFVADIGELPED